MKKILLIALILVTGLGSHAQTSCSTAVSITVKTKDLDCFPNYTSVGTVDVGSAFTPVGSCSTSDDDAWWATFTATSTTTEFFMWGKGNSNASFIVYSGNCSALTQVYCANTGSDNNPTYGSATTVPGQTYYILVHKKMTTARLCVYSSTAEPAKDACTASMSFEDGTSNGWIGKWGGYRLVSSPGMTFTWDLEQTGKPAQKYQVVTGNGRDPEVGMISEVAPGGGTYSFRLGSLSTTEGYMDTVSGVVANHAAASSMTYCFTVSSQNAGFGYKYATIMDAPSHPAELQPLFDVFLTVQATGDTVACGKYEHFPHDNKSPFYYVGDDVDVMIDDGIAFTPWNDVLTDLSGYAGQNICVTFRVRDCEGGGNTACCPYTTVGAGTHWAYTYFDTYCTPITIQVPEFCSGDTSVQICAPQGYLSYSWPAGQPGLSGSPTSRCVTISNPVPGTSYTVNMTSVSGCQATLNIPILSIPIVGTGDTTICKGNSANLTVSINNGLYPPYTYSWSGGLGSGPSVSVTPSNTTDYTVTVTNSKGCSAVKTIKVTVQTCNAPTVAVTGGTACSGGCVNVSASGSSGIPPYTYAWSPNIGTGPGPHSVCPSTSTIYTVTITDSQGNSASSTGVVTIGGSLTVSAGTDQYMCAGSSVNLTASGGTSYTWSPSTGLSCTTCQNPVASPTTTTTYTVTATSGGCTGTDSVTVYITSPPSISFTVPDSLCEKNSGIITFTGSASPGANYQWDFGGGSATPTGGPGPFTVTWETPGIKRIYLTVTESGCPSAKDSANVTIEPCDIIIPNILIPDNDGKNDYFFIKGLEKHPNTRLVIYNRWGIKIYENGNYINNWDGRHYRSQARLSDGVYYYIVTMQDGKTYNGFVTLIREDKF